MRHPTNRARLPRLVATVESRIDELATAFTEGRDLTRPMLMLNKLENILDQLKGDGWRPLQ